MNTFIVGIDGPVGSGKTALIDSLCKGLRDDYELAVVTNDIFTEEDAEALPQERIRAVQTVDDAGVELATVEPSAGGLYLRRLAREGVALWRELLRFLSRHRAQSGLAPVDFTRYTTMLS